MKNHNRSFDRQHVQTKDDTIGLSASAQLANKMISSNFEREAENMMKEELENSMADDDKSEKEKEEEGNGDKTEEKEDSHEKKESTDKKEDKLSWKKDNK
jgi:hypothetical protein